MSKYVHGNEVVEAFQFSPSFGHETYRLPDNFHFWPDENGAQPRDMSWGYIETPIGRVHVTAGNWIIDRGDKQVVCDNATFMRDYKPVVAQS